MWGHVWMSRFRGAWQNPNFDKEYLWFWDFSLCNLRDLIYAQSACNTAKKNESLIASYNPFKHSTIILNVFRFLSCCLPNSINQLPWTNRGDTRLIFPVLTGRIIRQSESTGGKSRNSYVELLEANQCFQIPLAHSHLLSEIEKLKVVLD